MEQAFKKVWTWDRFKVQAGNKRTTQSEDM